MKLAVIGSRGLTVEDLGTYLPDDVTEIVSGGAKGIDTCAAAYARAHGLKLTVFLPQYDRYRRAAPRMRNVQIVEYADAVLALWDGRSKGTKHVIDTCRASGKPLYIYELQK